MTTADARHSPVCAASPEAAKTFVEETGRQPDDRLQLSVAQGTPVRESPHGGCDLVYLDWLPRQDGFARAYRQADYDSFEEAEGSFASWSELHGTERELDNIVTAGFKQA